MKIFVVFVVKVLCCIKISSTQIVRSFRSGNFDVKNEPHSGRSIIEKNDQFLRKIRHDRHIRSHCIAYELKIHTKFNKSFLTICKRLGSKRNSMFECLMN